jgi:rod shape-determining protein MreC
MTLFPQKYRPALLFIFFLLFAALVLFGFQGGQSSFSMPEQSLLSVVSQVQKALNACISLPLHAWKKYVNLVNTQEENRLLSEENKRLKQENVLLQEAAFVNLRLRKLLDFKDASAPKIIAAEVVSVSASSYFESIEINKGRGEGIGKDMAVVAPEGVVGKVLKVGGGFSTVLLLVDQGFALDGLIQRTRGRGIVEGLGKNRCAMRYLLQSEDVQVGDLVTASGLEGFFPKGTIIGEVVSLPENKSSLFKDVLIKPSVEFETLEEVFVVVKQ